MLHKITQLKAVDLVQAVRTQAVTAREAVQASLDTIADLDGEMQAFISVNPEQALDTATDRDRIQDPQRMGPLHGVPVAVKDVTDVQGFTTTQGSLLMGAREATADDVSISRLRAAGAVVIGKTNTPEFGFGAVCTNKFRGPTCNPWDPQLTSGGSSGGSAVAVTTGMVTLAQGVDFGGSVRTPASFCGCVGLRPTPGVIPEPSRPLAWSTLATQGVLARNVDDAELMLTVMAGPHRYDPTSYHVPSAKNATEELRVATSVTLNDAYVVDPQVRSAFARATETAAGVFSGVEEAAPVVAGASEAFKVLRAAESWVKFGELVNTHESALTESFVWNVRRGREITAETYLRAEMVRSTTYRAFIDFFDRYDVLMLPAASVLPFPNVQGEVMEIDGQATESIIDYLACTYLISLVGFPAMVLPAPMTEGGVPFGVQLVARPGDEGTLFRAARMLENQGGFQHHWPTQDRADQVSHR